MTQMDLFYILIALGAIWTIIWLRLITSVPRVEPEDVVEQHVDTLRRRLIFPMGGTLLVGLAFSLYFMPYPRMRTRTVGTPTVTVNVAGVQWAWIIDQKQVPARTPVEFAITSRDVNHDFAIYSPDGRLLTQAQAMPGYTNRLIYKFDEPGTYTIRCLEYCGLGHHGMISQLAVV